MSLHMILKRHCYGHLDLSANPDDCDWIKRLKKKNDFLLFFPHSYNAQTWQSPKILQHQVSISTVSNGFILSSPTSFDPHVFIHNLDPSSGNLGSPVIIKTPDTVPCPILLWVTTDMVLLAEVLYWLIKYRFFTSCFLFHLHLKVMLVVAQGKTMIIMTQNNLTGKLGLLRK